MSLSNILPAHGSGQTSRNASALGHCPLKSQFVVYVLRCADGSLYAGWTNDLGARLAAHRAGTGSRYVRSRLPVDVRAFWTVRNRGAALRDEARFKALDRSAKLAALAKGQVFGRKLRNAPDVPEPPRAARPGGTMPALTPPTGAELDALALEAETARARIKTKKGDIVFRFYPHDAKQHSAAFIKLARAGFYDGLKFHRVEPKFVIQGGCPQGTGTGGPGYQLAAEFNDKPHVKGTVAMARSANPNSAGSQFYICIDDARFLDKQYTVFGQTLEGQDVVDQIRVGDVMEKVTIET
jgi:cyclophilin family peptidyl-prolyl cis-trans isomerase/predicted GIY-YIG superfamily endonuclease